MTSSEHRIKYPFIVVDVEAFWDSEIFDEGECFIPTITQWKPGVEMEPRYPDDTYTIANGEGFMVITEISRHKLPSPYPERVFYTRKWIDPDGKEFGKGKLHITSKSNFNKIINGYFGEEYIVEDAENEG